MANHICLMAVRIAVIGSGYVGLVSGACFAAAGHDVVCVDNDAGKIAQLQRGLIPIFEPGLAQLTGDMAAAGRLSFTTDLHAAVAGSEAVFICVGTPPSPVDGNADTQYVLQASAQIADALAGYTVIVNKSTVPVGTGEEVEAIIRTRRPDAAFSVVSNPEFLREGAAIADFAHPERIVVGLNEQDGNAAALLRKIYRQQIDSGVPFVETNRRTAEIIKYAANCFLALKITFINEIANLCELVGGDVQQVARGIGHDSRIGAKFLQAGPGFGGSCFPKDMLALMKTAQDHGKPLRLIETAVAVNDARKGEMTRKIVAALGGSVDGKKIAVLGLTFKPETDDLRSAPSLTILPHLVKLGAAIHAYDPAGQHEAARLLPAAINYAASAREAMLGADAVVLLTEWREFGQLDPCEIRSLLSSPVMIDLRNQFDPGRMQAAGLSYISIGR